MITPPANPMLFDNPDMARLYNQMREDFIEQAEDLLHVSLRGLVAYQEASLEEFTTLFDLHMHRYQQAFLYLNSMDLLESAMLGFDMRSALLKPDMFGSDSPYVPTLTQGHTEIKISYAESHVDPSMLETSQIYTRVLVSLHPDDDLPWDEGQRCYASPQAEVEPVLISVYPEERSVLILWSDQVGKLLVAGVDRSQYN